MKNSTTANKIVKKKKQNKHALKNMALNIPYKVNLLEIKLNKHVQKNMELKILSIQKNLEKVKINLGIKFYHGQITFYQIFHLKNSPGIKKIKNMNGNVLNVETYLNKDITIHHLMKKILCYQDV